MTVKRNSKSIYMTIKRIFRITPEIYPFTPGILYNLFVLSMIFGGFEIFICKINSSFHKCIRFFCANKAGMSWKKIDTFLLAKTSYIKSEESNMAVIF